MGSLSIEERLVHYFLAMGAQLVEQTQNASPGLTLVLGSDKVHVSILKNEAFLQRGKVIEAIMNLACLRETANQLYLAAPRLLGATVDAELFRSHGIGLLLFDDRRIDETVAPQSARTVHQESITEKFDPVLLTEVETLKSMYSEMERTVSRLREDLRSFQEASSSTVSPSNKIHQPSIVHLEPKFAAGGADLPSFFSNNPWLEVLSRRGSEEAVPIAG